MAQLGQTAAELLVDRLQNAGEPKVEHRVFPVEIIERQSVAAPPARDLQLTTCESPCNVSRAEEDGLSN